MESKVLVVLQLEAKKNENQHNKKYMQSFLNHHAAAVWSQNNTF